MKRWNDFRVWRIFFRNKRDELFSWWDDMDKIEKFSFCTLLPMLVSLLLLLVGLFLRIFSQSAFEICVWLIIILITGTSTYWFIYGTIYISRVIFRFLKGNWEKAVMEVEKMEGLEYD